MHVPAHREDGATAARDDLWSTFAPPDAAPIAVLLSAVDPTAVKHVLFVPPHIREDLSDTSIAKIRAVVRAVFDAWPASTQTPTPVPTGACG